MSCFTFSRRTVATFDPYGAVGCIPSPSGPDEPACLALGRAEVLLDGETPRFESFALIRCDDCWLLQSRFDTQPARFLARARVHRLPDQAVEAGFSLLRDLWQLRLPDRVRLRRCREAGALGQRRWQQLLRVQGSHGAGPATEQARLSRELLAEGRSLHCVDGPIGTTEHVLSLRRSAGRR